MDFSGANSNLQQRMAASCAGINRRQSVLNALDIQIGQKILDIGCGGGHLLEEIALSVGPTGKSFGLDPSETQITSAKDRCIQLKNVEFLCQGAERINLPNNFFDSITSTQTLEYIENVDSVLVEAKRLLKSGGKFVNVSVLWDHFKFHGPENELNTLIHDAFRAHCFHQMLPMEMKSKLQNLGFYNIKNTELAFLITERNNNSPAKFTEDTIAKFALKEGISEDKVLDWRNQLALAEEQGHFGFTSFPVLTEALLK